MLAGVTPLPIDARLEQIVAALRRARNLVLVAEPGAGKTTRVPPALLRGGVCPGRVVLLQPRRVAARAAAARIAEENGWVVGREVGHHVRFDRRIGPQTRLHVLTEGILLRQLVDDPTAEGIGCVLLDEFHERSIHTDLALALLREVQQTIRGDLRIVVMSATLMAAPVAAFLGGAEVVRVEGRTFPVEIEHRGVARQEVEAKAAEAALDLLDGAGDVLVFQSGAEEIRRTLERLAGSGRRGDAALLPLHGSLPLEQQVAALRPGPRRRVVVATNIAETSLTIDGVRGVVDSGLARVAGFDAQRGIDRLEVARISRASATQRAGRAGRTAPGRCIRLWSENEHAAMREFDEPEIRRVDLAPTVLALHAWGLPDPRRFAWFEAPDADAVAAAERLLHRLGALDEPRGRVTPLGQRMMRLPVHPRLGRLLLEAEDAGCLAHGAAVAALLSERDILRRGEGPALRGDSDLWHRVELLERARQVRFDAALESEGMDPSAARAAWRLRDELLRLMRHDDRHADSGDATPATHRRLLLCAYPDRVCRRRGADPHAGAMVGGGGVRLDRDSGVLESALFLALDLRADDRAPHREALVRQASAVDLAALEHFHPRLITTHRDTVFDPQRRRVVGRVQTRYLDLVIRESLDAAVESDEAGPALAAALRPRLGAMLAQSEAATTLLARLDLVRRHAPEHAWPAMDEATMEALLERACAGRRAEAEVDEAALCGAIESLLAYPLDRLLDRLAPRAVDVPSGSRIRVRYAGGQKPWIEVRLQEMFGCAATPRIVEGRVPLLLHLLGPNHRAVQVTEDLAGFWERTYPQVRKDLRARYPRHAWPEDPRVAVAQAKGGRRREA